MKRKFVAPLFAFIAFTNKVAFESRCNFALRSDDCCDLQYK